MDQVVAGPGGRGGEKWSDLGHIWKAEPTGLLRVGGRCERKGEARVSLRLLVWSCHQVSWEDEEQG